MDSGITKVNDLGIKSELEKLFAKIKLLIEKNNNFKEENYLYKQKIKDLEQAFSEMKIELSNMNSALLNKDKDISELKNRLLDEKKNKISGDEKSMLKSRIRELMIRLDTHLEQKANNNF